MIYSKYVRLTYATSSGGMVQCCTCGASYHWTKIQNGHYISRAFLLFRWDDRNCHPQCVRCNVFQYGRPDDHAIYIQDMYGGDVLRQLRVAKDVASYKAIVVKMTDAEVQTLIDKFTTGVTRLLEEKNL